MPKLTQETPFEVRSIVVGNIQYPAGIVMREKEKRVIEAGGIAQAARIISQRLTAAYLQYAAIKAQRDTINAQNATTIHIPGVPIVASLNVPGQTVSQGGTPPK